MLPFVLIWLLMVIKYFELFTIPGWLMGGALILGSLTFLMSRLLNRKEEDKS
jgi:Kef-type K+ transport system membrane component KefB